MVTGLLSDTPWRTIGMCWAGPSGRTLEGSRRGLAVRWARSPQIRAGTSSPSHVPGIRWCGGDDRDQHGPGPAPPRGSAQFGTGPVPCCTCCCLITPLMGGVAADPAPA